MSNNIIYKNINELNLTTDDLYFFGEGTHYKLYEKLGAHLCDFNGEKGVIFRVWAPNAKEVSVIGGFNYWTPGSHKMFAVQSSGIWETFIPNINPWEMYKYHIISHHNNYHVEKSDPFAFHNELPPKTASVVCDIDSYNWNDNEWMKIRTQKNSLEAPMSIYELHLGSWMHKKNGESLTYREMAEKLTDYIIKSGFTHVEFMPVMEHPYYGSWGYQITGYYAPTSRYGIPQDFMYLIDILHQNNIGIILDWVPSHFATDLHGLSFFDGTHLYEHADPRKGYHPDWGSYIFNYGRNEVKSFLISNAFYWLEKHHIDGLRVDAVASMLYLDYSRKEGQWIPNMFGGRENLEAIDFLKKFNEAIYSHFPGVQTIAEESTSWGGVSKPTYNNGLGFGFKWDMGWMHDTLEYMQKDPIHRRYHHGYLTFRSVYAFSENFILPLSHDEVVHGKGSLLNKMPCDDWQKFANLRLLYGYMFANPGKKLIFMGSEFGQWNEWENNHSIDWHLTQWDRHHQVYKLIQDLNKLYKCKKALHKNDCHPYGFWWIDGSDNNQSVFSFLRVADEPEDTILVACNFTPMPRHNYRLGVPIEGYWDEICNTDSHEYGGAGIGNFGSTYAHNNPCHGYSFSVDITIPPLGMVMLEPGKKYTSQNISDKI